MLGRTNDLYSTGTSAEDQMRINAIRYESEEVYQRNLYKEAAKRVVFANCMNNCELDKKSLPNFNRQFYYGMPQAQACLQDCYNTRMKLHFGSAAEKEALLIDFQDMKKEYQRYENWHPMSRLIKDMQQDAPSEYVDQMTQKLLEKTKASKGKFNFQ